MFLLFPMAFIVSFFSLLSFPSPVIYLKNVLLVSLAGSLPPISLFCVLNQHLPCGTDAKYDCPALFGKGLDLFCRLFSSLNKYRHLLAGHDFILTLWVAFPCLLMCKSQISLITHCCFFFPLRAQKLRKGWDSDRNVQNGFFTRISDATGTE